MKKIGEFLQNYAFVFMLIGMAVAFIGVLNLMQIQKTGAPKGMAITISLCGLLLYILGRISLFFKSKKRSNKNNSLDA